VGGQGKVGGSSLSECNDTSGEALRPYWNVSVPPEVRSQYGQSNRLEIASSTRNPGDDTPAIDTNKDNSDYETGCSEHS